MHCLSIVIVRIIPVYVETVIAYRRKTFFTSLSNEGLCTPAPPWTAIQMWLFMRAQKKTIEGLISGSPSKLSPGPPSLHFICNFLNHDNSFTAILCFDFLLHHRLKRPGLIPTSLRCSNVWLSLQQSCETNFTSTSAMPFPALPLNTPSRSSTTASTTTNGINKQDGLDTTPTAASKHHGIPSAHPGLSDISSPHELTAFVRPTSSYPRL
jgi:hypothetical protein